MRAGIRIVTPILCVVHRSGYPMRLLSSLLTFAALLILPIALRAQFPAKCDGDKSCVGSALTIDVTYGKGAQYVDVDTSAVLRSLDTAITFEAWILPQAQPGKRQFIAGLWGPNKDNNDQWVLYLEDEKISFELSPDGTRLGSADNTIASATIPGLYALGWVHVAAVWDAISRTARIYLNGTRITQGANAQYPLTRLHRIESPTLTMQIGSCNGLYDDTVRYRTFKGEIDEVRLWRRSLSAQEITCQRLLSLDGNEPGLILYYRFNETKTTQNLCDASGNGIVGRMRSGARCDVSTRTVPATYIVAPSSVTSTMRCINRDSVIFSIQDTSVCGSRVHLSFSGGDQKNFSVSPADLVLTPNTPFIFTVTVNTSISGTVATQLVISNANRCGDPVRVPLTFARTTELDYSKGRLRTDTLFVGCLDRTFSEDTLTICNPAGRPMTIFSASLGGTAFTWRPAPGSAPLPAVLQPNGCWQVIVRMNVGDSSKTELDTLRITSTDTCPGNGVIPITGRTQEVLTLLDGDGKNRIDTMAFEDVCPGFISSTHLYQYRDMVNEPIQIDTIYFTPNNFFGRRNVYPLKLAPSTAYQATFVRFRPDIPGPMTGEMHVVVKNFHGCTIDKVIKMSGGGISVQVDFNESRIDFGNVVIGLSAGKIATVTNTGKDQRKISAYLKVGDAFSLGSGSLGFTIDTGQTIQIPITFRPREPITYYDTLCIFDIECYQTRCIPISGTGIFDALSFTPPYLRLENVIGCRCKTDTIEAKNITGAPLAITKAVLNDPTGKFSVATPIPSGTLPPNGSYRYAVTYCPNDLTDDRADQATIDLTLGDGRVYQVQLRGTSAAPKLYVTPLTTFGVVEVGWNATQRILIENTSSVPVRIDAINVPSGYTITGTTPPIPTTLPPRDSLWVDVKFAPTSETDNYNGQITISSSDPCTLSWSGDIEGRGQVVKLDVPLTFINYGLVKPCDCAIRELPLPNTSAYIPIRIDSIWIDGAGLTNANPKIFVWQSRQSGGTTLPYSVAPGSTDTLLISFCPNIPATQANLLANARLHIKASTPGWSQEFTTVMSGRREMNFQPNTSLVQFPTTRVDTAAAPSTVQITVPDQFVNPSGDSVVITAVTFVPDQRVFTATAANGAPLPWVIKRGEKFQIKVGFYPRAPKQYVARMHLRTSFPCDGEDTTILVQGEGFAPAFGLQMAFDTSAVGQDTLRLTTCDTLSLPVMITRDIPQKTIDIAFRIGYDSTALSVVDVRSPFTANAAVADTGDGARVLLKDARSVTAGTFAIVRFAVKGGATAFPIKLDQIDFDSDSLVFFKIVAGIDNGWVIIDQPMIGITKLTDFDTVNVRSCADRDIVVYNPGLIPVRFDSLAGLPPGHRVVASTRAYPDTLAPGDSITLTVRFCAYREQLYDTMIYARSSWPCPIADTGTLHSFGYAPPFPMRLGLDSNFARIDTIGVTIADTVEVPVVMDRDIPQTPLDVGFTLLYNPRALKIVGIRSPYTNKASFTQTQYGLAISLPHCDSIRRGEIARLRFVGAVPDSVISMMLLNVLGSDFTSDSAFWIKLVPTGDTSVVRIDPQCNIVRLNFRGGANKLSAPKPNPATGHVRFDLELLSDSKPKLSLYNSAGVEVTRLLDGSSLLPGGTYGLDLDVSTLPSGSYFAVLTSEGFNASQRLEIVK